MNGTDTTSHRILGTSGRGVIGLLLAVVVSSVMAADVTRPNRVAELLVDRSATDIHLSWDPVTEDVVGSAETVTQYHVYRGTTPNFVPDKIGATNRVGSSLVESFSDPGAAQDAASYYYLISAVDASGNESGTKAPQATPPTLSGFWTDTTIEVDWTGAAPVGDIASYRVYHGKLPGEYESVADVALASAHTLSGLQTSINWYIAVTAVDGNGNESAFSNEHIDAVAGRVKVSAHVADELCWGASSCTPTDPEKIQRNDGFQLLVPTRFPEGDWVSATVTFVMDSRLCSAGNMGTLTKCGSGNPCVSPPCNGGYNPCGDPWDRLAHLFVVLDDCVATGGDCITANNLELIRAVTPFGSDAFPPNGTAAVRPRKLSVDLTPLVPLLTGTKHVGANIAHFVQKGWWVSTTFEFSERPEEASPKPPADGIEIVGFGGAPLPTKQISIPSTATQVKARIYTSGHGGSSFCDGGPNNAQSCTSGVDCPGGVCNPCDEFCHRENQLLLDGTPIWQVTPYRTDCSPGPSCSTWNACGFPSCTFPRAGWCPGYVACHHNAPCDNDIDFTVDIPAGGTYDFDYQVLLQNGTWPVSVVLYWYE